MGLGSLPSPAPGGYPRWKGAPVTADEFLAETTEHFAVREEFTPAMWAARTGLKWPSTRGSEGIVTLLAHRVMDRRALGFHDPRRNAPGNPQFAYWMTN